MKTGDTAEYCLSTFLPVVREWFTGSIGEPSLPQLQGWPQIAEDRNVLICAPTGSGKTLAAFLKCLDMIYATKQPDVRNRGIRILYISPLKALNNDIYRNLEVPLSGIREKASELGIKLPDIEVAVRTGDTPQKERSRMLRNPPDILITTPESLFIMLTSTNARQLFATVEQVIIDEIHSICSNKRGVHLALSLERVERIAGKPVQRIGLSATINPVEEVARYLAGFEKKTDDAGNIGFGQRPITIVNCDRKRKIDLTVSVPVKDMRSLPDGSIWPEIYHQLLTLIRAHKSTLIFVNNRRLAEQVASGINSLADEAFVKTHHGSVSREIRQELEKQLKEEKLSCLVATSTLELGIDIGNIELVVQVGSPGSVASTLQRIGRAGHNVHAVSRGCIIPKTRSDLLDAAFIACRTRQYDIENIRIPLNCLDVLAQQITSVACEGTIHIQEAYELIKGAYSYGSLPYNQFERVVEMLGDPSPADEPGLIRPRIYYDRVNGNISGNSTGRAMCLNSGGTIPDKGYYPVYIKNSNLKLGELEEEFVFESRIGERFLLGSSVWKLEIIESDRVIVSPSNDSGAKLPFWKGDDILRPYEIGVKFGRFLKMLEERLQAGDFMEWVCENCGFDATAAENLMEYVKDQIVETGGLHSDRGIVCEYFSDETGDRRIIIHSPFGGSIHAALAMILHLQLSKVRNCEIEYVYSDNGILFHFLGYTGGLNNILSLVSGSNVEEEIFQLLPGAPMFNLNMRYNLGRSLLLSSRGFGRRKPLWIQRLRSAEILNSLAKIKDHPVFIETFRECLNDMLDLNNLVRVLEDIRTGSIRVREIVTNKPSPFSSELLFSFWQVYEYVYDLPIAEKRNQLLVTDRSFIQLAAGMNAEYELLDPRAVKAVGKELEKARYGMKVSGEEELYYFLHTFGELKAEPYGTASLRELSYSESLSLLSKLEAAGRVVRMTINASGEPYWVAVEDYPQFCRVLQLEPDDQILTIGVPGEEKKVRASDWLKDSILAVKVDVQDAAVRILRRVIRFSVPFGVDDLRQQYKMDEVFILKVLEYLEKKGEILRIREARDIREVIFCHQRIYEKIKKKTITMARQEIEPKEENVYCSFLLEYQGIGEDVLPPDEKLVEVLRKMQGLFLPAAWWEDFVLPARISGYEPKMLDYLCATGMIRWIARINKSTREVAFLFQEEADFDYLLSEGVPDLEPFEKEAWDALKEKGACFLKDYAKLLSVQPLDLLNDIERLVWNGLITNDSFAVVRYYLESDRKNSPWVRYNTYPNMGRWSIVDLEREKRDEKGLVRYITQLLDRYGILTKEILDCEKTTFKWSEVYICLKNNEFTSGIKRGLYVSGLSGLQFARDFELELLRKREGQVGEKYTTLCTCDPANPYKEIFAKNTQIKTSKNQGSAVVLKNGTTVLLVKDYGGCIIALDHNPDTVDKALDNFIEAYNSKKLWTTRKNLFTEHWGEEKNSIEDSPVYQLLVSKGYNREYKGVTLWRKVNY
jgi:ATP-dependent helicase Lhr and Lhr-like helicase